MDESCIFHTKQNLRLNLCAQVLQDVADDFVENLAAFACELALHRSGTTLEARDIQLALGALCKRRMPAGSCTHDSECVCPVAVAEKNWNMRLVGVGDNLAELKVIKKTAVTEAHKGRLADVRRSKLNNHR